MQMNSIVLVLKGQADMKVFAYVRLSFVFMGSFTFQVSLEKYFVPPRSWALDTGCCFLS